MGKMGKVAQEQRFECRFCSKRFFSGKSLGGHMRCHLALISASKRNGKLKIKEEDEEEGGGGIDDGAHRNSKNFSPVLSNSSFSDGDDDDRERYGSLKKSLGVSPNLVHSDDMVLRKRHMCKECFRKFPSAKALAGHMRTHSPKLLRNQEQEQDEHVCKTCGKGFDSVRALYGHMKSHSKRERFRSISADFDLAYPRKKRSVLIRHRNGPNPPVSEEVENAAMGLMMLSKDTWDCIDKAEEMKERNLDSCSSEFTDIVSDDPRNNDDSDQKDVQLVDCEGDLNSPDASKGCCLTSTECCNSSPDSAAMVVSENLQGDPKSIEASDQKDVKLVVSDRDLNTPVASKCNEDDGNDSVVFSGSLKREYKCASCDKMFRTHQALGGHRNRWRMLGSCPTNTECSDISPDSANPKLVFEPSKISQEHECEICFKVFPTGQALGGHKRAHYNANHDLRCVQNNSFFGLNDAGQGGVGFKPWWIGNAALLT